MHKDQAHKDQAHKDRAHKDRAHKDRAHSLNSKMEKNEDFLKWTKISEVFPNLSPWPCLRWWVMSLHYDPKLLRQ